MSTNRLWRVDLERSQTATIYVLATEADDAIEDARVLVGERDWVDDFRPSASAYPSPSSGRRRVWSGGADGDWLDPMEGDQ